MERNDEEKWGCNGVDDDRGRSGANDEEETSHEASFYSTSILLRLLVAGLAGFTGFMMEASLCQTILNYSCGWSR